VLTIYGTQYIRTASISSVSGTVTIDEIPTNSGQTAQFDYVIVDGSGNARAGTVIAVWDNSTATYTDTSTTDLNGSTLGFEFIVDVSGGNARLRAVVTSGTWTVKVGTRVIF
jgi:hypothetical protein